MEHRYRHQELLKWRHERQMERVLFSLIFSSFPPRKRVPAARNAIQHISGAPLDEKPHVQQRNLLLFSLSDLPPGTKIVRAEPGMELPENAIPVAISSSRMITLENKSSEFFGNTNGVWNGSLGFGQLAACRSGASTVNDSLRAEKASRAFGAYYENQKSDFCLSLWVPCYQDAPMYEPADQGSYVPGVPSGSFSLHASFPAARSFAATGNFPQGAECALGYDGLDKQLHSPHMAPSAPGSREYAYNYKYTPFFEKYIRSPRQVTPGSELSLCSNSSCEIQIQLPEPSCPVQKQCM